MKACIVGNMNLKHMTLLSLYTSYFESRRIKYDVIYIDQYGIEEECNAEKIYKYLARDTKKRIINKFLVRGFQNYCKKILLYEKYDFIVVWREETAILLSGLLTKYYKNKYSVNIRDIEICIGRKKNSNLKKLGLVVKNAALNTISSDGFIRYLPQADYLFIHSANAELLKTLTKTEGIKELSNQIIISNIGSFRNDSYCFQIADAFADDDRFELRFIGSGSERMQKYVDEKKYTNIKCEGAFLPKDTIKFVEDADIINCAYGRESIAEEMKLPIRFYYAIYLKKTVLSTEGTWIERTADRLGIGISIPDHLCGNNQIAGTVFSEYIRLKEQENSTNLEKYINEVEISHKRLEVRMDQFFYKIRNRN